MNTTKTKRPTAKEFEAATKIADLAEATIKLTKPQVIYRSLACEYDIILNGKVIRPGYKDTNPEQPVVPSLALKLLEQRGLGYIRKLPNPKGKGRDVLALICNQAY